MTLRSWRQPLLVVGFVAAGSIAFAHSHVHRNLSDSLPIAAPYLVWSPSAPVRVGDLVEACPPLDAALQARQRGYAESGSCPGGVAPFLKLVAAIAGDVVTTTPKAVLVDGHALPNSAQVLADSKGRRIVTRPYGTHRLLRGQVWLYGTNPRSFDSRKFGPVQTTAVRFVAWAPIVSAPLPDLRTRTPVGRPTP